ncbi:hydrogenase nickel incorporation protein HypB [Acidiphilium sp.]|uniref:hydrogenase nickel incorporation protein HypB n=1 Tax=Acidiphilium sp. TaxID=527 RepID=UPI0025842BF6|nr:hydrogenase nickel incorporation protein HypB [Acidiphilium sp.]
MMCGICGCGDTGEHHHEHEHDHGHAAEHAHAAGLAPARMVRVEQDIMAANQRHADANRTYFAERGIFVVNLVSSPGSGKTSLLVRTVAALKAEMPVAVIEGDQQTEFDAERIRAAGAPAWQINTGKACHLDAHMVGHALEHLPSLEGGILFIENVGNLVCPAGFDLGEAHKVVILSVTEGEDKPLKYPHMFHAADLMLVNKIDLLPHVACDMELILAGALRVNPAIGSVAVSAATGEGFGAWLDWLRQGRERARRAQHGAMQARREALRRELASIDATLAG